MTICKIKLSTPVLSSLEGISWFRTDEELFEAQKNRGIGNPESLLHNGNSIIGEISDYPIYFLCSRPRLRLRHTPKTDGTKHEFISDPESATPFMHFCLQYDTPTYREQQLPLPEWCTMNIDSELSDLLKIAAGSDSKVVRCEVPKNHQFPNAISFLFEDGKEVAFYISPDLWPFMRFQLGGPGEANRFGPPKGAVEGSSFNFRVHYVGQSKEVDARINAHEKIRALSNHLQRNLLNEEAVVFVFKIEKHNVPNLSNKDLIDLTEACLISNFQPHLNFQFKDLKFGQGSKEINLRKRIKRAGISEVIIELPTPHKYLEYCFSQPFGVPTLLATSMAMGEYYSIVDRQRRFWADMQPLDFRNI